MKAYFPYPINAEALEEFTHPEQDVFSRPRRHNGEMLAANGYVALRAHKGFWNDQDYPEAGEAFLSRFNCIPWGYMDRLQPDKWRELDPVRGTIYRYHPIKLWKFDREGRPSGHRNASPVWRVGGCLVRLSALQLVAKLPRVEVYTGSTDARRPLWFRFNGGVGAIAYDRRLMFHSFELFGNRPGRLDGPLA